jgi:two-component system, sensor histidine kinase PdtaS
METPTPVEPATSHGLAQALLASLNVPLLMLDGDCTIISASTAFGLAFQLDPDEIVGRPLAELGDGEWAVPQLDALVRATASGTVQAGPYEMDLKRKGQDDRRLVIQVQRLDYGEAGLGRLLVTVADVTVSRAIEKLKDNQLREKTILLQELQHRVANSLQIIASVLMQKANRVGSEETRLHLRDAHHRVMSVAAIQHQLARATIGAVELRPYFTDLCRSIGASMIRDHGQLSLSVTADASVADSDVSVSLGLIVTELVINALKHAFPDQRSGKISVDYHSSRLGWTLSVSDNGVGMPAAGEIHSGLGSTIVQALARKLDAAVAIFDTNPGTRVSIDHS